MCLLSIHTMELLRVRFSQCDWLLFSKGHTTCSTNSAHKKTNAILGDKSWVRSCQFEPAYIRGIIWFLSYFKSSAEVSNTNCIPLHTTEERHLLFDDYFVIKTETIQSCQKESVACQRLPRWVTFYPETKFRESVDVGVCSGQCRDSMTCEPVWTKSKAIPTPHGKQHQSDADVITQEPRFHQSEASPLDSPTVQVGVVTLLAVSQYLSTAVKKVSHCRLTGF